MYINLCNLFLGLDIITCVATVPVRTCRLNNVKVKFNFTEYSYLQMHNTVLCVSLTVNSSVLSITDFYMILYLETYLYIY